MNYLKILGLCNNYTEDELDNNYYERIKLILPYLDESPRLMGTFADVETSYEFLKEHTGLMSFSNEELKINQSKIMKTNEMFNKLNDSFNLPIKVIYISNGEINEVTGMIENISKFDKIKLVSGETISFLNYDEAIMKVFDDKGNLLYFNPFINISYKNFNEDELVYFYQKCYGETIGLSYFEINKLSREFKGKKVSH